MRWLAGGFALAAFALPFVLFGGRTWLSLVLLSAALSAAASAAAGLVPGARFQRGVLALGAVTVLIGVAQLLPLPASLVASLSPVRARLQAAVPVADLSEWPKAAERRLLLGDLLAQDGDRDSEQGTEEAGDETRATAAAMPLSFDPAGTAVAVLALAAFLLLLSALAGQPDERLGLGLLVPILTILAAGACYGLWHSRTGGPLYGLFEPPPFDHHRPYGTFWNLNHFSALSALACPVLLAAALERRRHPGWRIGALLLLAPTAAAVLDAGSRGGLLAGGIGAILLGLFLLRRGQDRRAGAALLGLSFAALLLAFTLFSERLIDESFEQTTAASHDSNRMRLELYARQAEMIRTAPFAGHGLGAFHDAHGPYKTSPESYVPYHGESDLLETAVESGLLGWLAWAGLLALLWRPPLEEALGGRAPPLLLGLLAGSMATLAHSAVDYHHREPAVALVSCVLAGTAHAWALRLRRAEGESPARTLVERILAPAALVLAVLLHLPVKQALRFDFGREGALRALESGDASTALSRAREAADARPSDGTGWALVAAAHERLGIGLRGEAAREQRRLALEASAEAVRRSPATLGAARRAGSLLLAVGALDEARRAAELGVVAAPGHSASRQLLGEVLLALDRPSQALPHLAFAFEGVPFARLSELSPSFAGSLRDAAEGSASSLFAALRSDEHRAWYLSTLGRSGLASELPPYFAVLVEEPAPERARSYAGVLTLAPGPDSAALAAHLLPGLEESWPRSLAARALVLGGRPEEALPVLTALLEREDAPAIAFLTLAEVLGKQGSEEEAAEALRAGLERHPGEVSLAQRLAALEALEAKTGAGR